MPFPLSNEGFTPDQVNDDPDPVLHEVPAPVAHDRSDDELEAESVKYNIARVVRLSSGRFALFSHYREGTLDLIKVGTIEEIAPHIPLASECALTVERPRKKPGNSADILADLGL